MKHEVVTKSMGGIAFNSTVDHHEVIIDAHTEFGGMDQGPTPKPLLLTSLSGCTGMDVISLLKKMRVEIKDFEIKVTGTLTDEHPKHYSHIFLQYIFTGINLDKKKIDKAVQLSQERYCGVSYMLGKVAKLDYDITLNEV
ncbi:MAG: OsmC family protein [Cyclobacteriaceae bacterium]|nr:OsmC family protein [Cyclobacteriaceae bacterium]